MQKSSLTRLKLSNFKLNILLEITSAINENSPTQDLIDRYEEILTQELNIGKVMIFHLKNRWGCLLSSGIDPDLIEKIDFKKNLLPINDITSVTNNKLFPSFDLIIPVFHKEKALSYVLIGDIDEEQEGMSPSIKHIHFIQTLTNIIIVAIENKRLYKENLKQEAFKKELELASKMQEMLIPDDAHLPQNEKLFVHGFYLPHFDVGGDYYDYIELNENEIGFCIADVSGKGISAALLMSNFQANLRALFSAEISLSDLVKRLNKIVAKITGGDRFITLFVAKYNFKTRELEFINAGHNPPILYNKKKSEIIFLENGCVGLGMLDEIQEIHKGYLKIDPNTKILCFTDGLIEVENEECVPFGVEHIESFIVKNKPIDLIVNDLMFFLNDFRGKNILFDDISILGLEIY
jgi:sigma-B regulation protein RsbU (phosphoserine phosphatase)